MSKTAGEASKFLLRPGDRVNSLESKIDDLTKQLEELPLIIKKSSERRDTESSNAASVFYKERQRRFYY